MKLDYFDKINPEPLITTIGIVKKPTLKDIAKLGFETFNFYVGILKTNPLDLLKTQHLNIYSNLTDNEKDNFGYYDLCKIDINVHIILLDILNFFFIEKVIYKDGFFIVLDTDDSGKEIIKSVINNKQLEELKGIILQFCGVSEEKQEEKPKFKNQLAEKIFAKIQSNSPSNKDGDKKLSIPNIISAVANKHNSLNYINIWDITLLQLFDTFARLQYNTIFDIDKTRVSVWGDESGKFDITLWYKYIDTKKEETSND